jgi:hypothetical protein
MADDEAQGQEASSRPAIDASTDSSLPWAFDEPLVWPESRTWEERPAREPAPQPLLGAEPPPPPHLDVQWQATEDDIDTTVHHDQALAGLGGGAEVAAPGGGGDIGLISTSALPTPPVHPAAEQSSDGQGWRRFDIRRGNVAVVGLISLVSLVLLGMFLSVRARNEVPTDSSQSQRPSDQISVTGSLNTVPLTTTTTAPTAAINIADLLPAVDAGAAPSSDPTAADAGSGSGSAGTTATPSGGGTRSGGGGGSTTATTQPAAQAPAPTSPPATSPTVEDTTPEDTAPPPANTTQARRPTPTFTFPGFPTTTGSDDDEPSYNFPSWSDIED